MALQLFEFLEQFIFDNFLIKTNPIWENWINRLNFNSAGNLKIKFHFRNKKLITFFRDLYTFAVR